MARARALSVAAEVTGWVLILALLLLALLALWRLARLDRTELQFVASALLLALAGYAWQGSPGVEGQPRPPSARAQAADGGLAELRRQMFGRFNTADRWLILADGYQSRGNTKDAAGAARAGIRAHPSNATLWIGLGNALVAHADGLLTPAAELAFRRGNELAPRHPGPKFFYGLALAQNGQLEAGERLWVEALALAPSEIAWRPVVERQLERLREAQAQPPV